MQCHVSGIWGDGWTNAKDFLELLLYNRLLFQFVHLHLNLSSDLRNLVSFLDFACEVHANPVDIKYLHKAIEQQDTAIP